MTKLGAASGVGPLTFLGRNEYIGAFQPAGFRRAVGESSIRVGDNHA